MSDTSNPSAPATPPAPDANGKQPKKRKMSPTGVKQSLLREVDKVEQLCLTAAKEPHATVLDDREISADFVKALSDDAGKARKQCADTTQSATGAKVATAKGAAAERDLLAALQEIQAAARQKYVATNPIMLKDYYVGLSLNGNRSHLKQASASILEKLGKDTLPGITPKKVTALERTRDAWLEATGQQSDDESDTETGVNDRNKLIQSIKDRRLQIQFAADAAYPHTNPDAEAARRAFQLPLDRPFVVRLPKAAKP